MASPLAQIGMQRLIPQSLTGGGIIKIGLWIAGSIIVCSIVLAIVILAYMMIKWNKRAVIFRKIGTKIQKQETRKACFEKVGQAGDRFFVIKGLKRTKDANIQMAKNEYWFFERADAKVRMK